MNVVLQEVIKRSQSYEEADFLNAILGEYKQEVLMGGRRVVLYGAGSAGEELFPLLKLHGVSPVCFCDSNPTRVGELHCGLRIISLSELIDEHRDSLIVITTGKHREQIKQQLVGDGFNQERILTIANQEAMCYYTHLAHWYWFEEDLADHAGELLTVYNLLSDEKSREIFVARIALFVHGSDFKSFRNFIYSLSDDNHIDGTDIYESMSRIDCNMEAYHQFNNDVIKFSDNEVLVDGGAYVGESTLEFIRANSSQALTYKKIICFEPDPKSFIQLQKNTGKYDNISLRPLGLWSHPTTIRFADSNVFKPGSTHIISGSDNSGSSGVIDIATTSIDNEFLTEHITVIKMDIEGAEMEALRGAMKTIVKCRPKLIISVYHKRDDIIEIPLLIHQMMPDYKLYLRHFSRNFGETLMFAIP